MKQRKMTVEVKMKMNWKMNRNEVGAYVSSTHVRSPWDVLPYQPLPRADAARDVDARGQLVTVGFSNYSMSGACLNYYYYDCHYYD